MIVYSLSIKGQTTLTQSVDPSTIDTNGNPCGDVNNEDYEDNRFYRFYNLSNKGITGDFQISSVEYGQGKARDGKQIKLTIHTVDDEDLTVANFTEIGSTTHTSSSANNGSLITVPLSLTIPAGSIIAFEVFAEKNYVVGTDTREDFVPGYNTAGELKASYRESPECTVPDPRTTTFWGIPDEYVMNVVGSEVLSVKDFESFELGITPNPASSFINIKLDQTNRVKNAELYDVMGKLVLQSYKTNTLDISRLKTGMYILKLNTYRGNAVRRIVKQ